MAALVAVALTVLAVLSVRPRTPAVEVVPAVEERPRSVAAAALAVEVAPAERSHLVAVSGSAAGELAVAARLVVPAAAAAVFR